ncbi:MAG: cytochrome c3 family protein [Anaerolineales bacterium]|nr:cytochrome c3 family protein [Anaerolineales bacterium]
MSQIFHRRANTVARISLFVVISLLVGLAAIAYLLINSPVVTGVRIARTQPVAYSHALHVGELGLDCRYCHTPVEVSNTAGIPPTETCMGCHAEIAPDSLALAPVRNSYAQNKPIEWVRVHNLPDYVYFNHAIHVKQGVGCETCHGRIDQMPVVAKTESMQMSWCLDCHRNPENHIRPRDAVLTMGWTAPTDQAEMGSTLVAEYGIEKARLMDCSVCHR